MVQRTNTSGKKVGFCDSPPLLYNFQEVRVGNLSERELGRGGAALALFVLQPLLLLLVKVVQQFAELLFYQQAGRCAAAGWWWWSV